MNDFKLIKGDVFVKNWGQLIEQMKVLIGQLPKKEDETQALINCFNENFVDLQDTLERVIDELRKIPKEQVSFVARGPGAGFPPNLDKWEVRVTTLSQANIGESLPRLFIPGGYMLVVRARNANIGNIFVSNSKANAEGTHRITLSAGEAVKINISNADQVFIAAATANDGVEYFYEK